MSKKDEPYAITVDANPSLYKAQFYHLSAPEDIMTQWFGGTPPVEGGHYVLQADEVGTDDNGNVQVILSLVRISI